MSGDHPMLKYLTIALAFLMTLSSAAFAASNEETIQYIFDQHEAEWGCQSEVRNAKVR